MDSLEPLINLILKKYFIKDVEKLINFLSDNQLFETEKPSLEKIYDIAALAHSKKNYREAAQLFLFLINKNWRRNEISEYLINAYYEPYRNFFSGNYNKNIQALGAYQHIAPKTFPAFSELKLKFMSYDKNYKINNINYLLYDSAQNCFIENYKLKAPSEISADANLKGRIVILNEAYDVNFILLQLEKTAIESVLWEKIPLYLYYSNREKFVEHLQICDFTKLLPCERVKFIFGLDELSEIMLNVEYHLPSLLLNLNADQTSLLGFTLEKLINIRNNNRVAAKKAVAAYYKNFDPYAIEEKYKKGELHIGFVTSRFTTALQYYVRDCILACKKLGVKTSLLIESSDINWCASEEVFDNYLSVHKPDILFIIDHFRWEYAGLPGNIPFVCWIQDFFPNLFSRQAAQRVGKFDFVLNVFTTSREFKQLGYPEEKLIDGPIMSNPDIYKKYELTSQEREAYSADICVISNAGYIEDGLAILDQVYKNSIPQNIKQTLVSITNAIYEDMYNEKRDYFDNENLKTVFTDFFNRRKHFLEAEMMNQLIENYRVHVLLNIYKTVPVMWLHERGYNLKIWGKSWVKHPVLKKYAMGVAKNGEVMSKILNATKISLGLHMIASLHPRIMEATLSGCLYIGNAIPEEHDFCSVKKYMKEDESIVFFHSKKDLFEKIDFYLANEAKREETVRKGTAVILKELTYEALMKNMLDKMFANLSKGKNKTAEGIA